VHNLYIVYLSISTCFGRLCAHHQEKQLCLCETWYLLFCVDDYLVCLCKNMSCLLSLLQRNPVRKFLYGRYFKRTSPTSLVSNQGVVILYECTDKVSTSCTLELRVIRCQIRRTFEIDYILRRRIRFSLHCLKLRVVAKASRLPSNHKIWTLVSKGWPIREVSFHYT
jgi:hypothetical protein